MDAVVIEYIGDTRGLTDAAEQLKALGQLTQDQYDQFVESNKRAQKSIETFEQRMKDQTERVTKNINEQAKAFDNLDVSIPSGGMDELDKQQKKVVESGKSLKAQLREIREQMAQLELAGKKNTAEFRNLARQGGILTDQLGDTSKQLQNLGNDERYIQAVGSALTGVVGAFAAGQGAVALFGDENEDLQKTMTKLFAAMTLVQGVQQVQETLNKDNILSTTLKTKAQEVYNYFVDQGTGKLIAMRVATAGLITLGIAAVIVGAVYAWRRFNETVDAGAISLETYKEIQSKVAEGTVNEKVKLNELLAVAKDHNISLDKRNEALRTLHEMSPKYLGDLTLEQIEQGKSTKAVNAYIDAIDRKAKAQALEGILADKYTELYTEQNKTVQESISTWQKFKIFIGAATQGAAGAYGELNNVINDNAKATDDLKNTINALEQELLSVNEEILNAGDDLDIFAPKVKAAAASIRESFGQAIELLPNPDQLKTDQVDPVLKTIDDFYKTVDDYREAARLKSKADVDAQREEWQKLYNDKAAIAQQSLNTLSNINNLLLNNELTTLNTQLANKQITQAQYDKAAAAAKTKEAKRAKDIAVFNALLDIPRASLEGLVQGGPALAVIYGLLASIDAGVIAATKIPQFAKGTPKAPAGFKWVGEQGPELINDAGGYPILSNPDSMQLVDMLNKYQIPSAPSLSDATIKMLSSGHGVPIIPGMDYDKLITGFGEQIRNNPGVHVNVDENGLSTFIQNGFNRTEILNKKFKN